MAGVGSPLLDIPETRSEAGRSPANEGVVRVRWRGFIEVTFYPPPEVTASLLTGRPDREAAG